MPMIRPAARAALSRWSEVILAGGVAVFGLWLLALGGVILWPIGLAVVALAGFLALTGWRRLRFRQAVAAPGVVEVVEGQVSYLGPEIGGFVSLTELTELRLITLRGRRLWRLKQADGQALLIPVDATGAEALFDAFASLPGMDMAALLAALNPAEAGDGSAVLPAGTALMRPLWHRSARGVLRPEG
jgi:hypothetical protein